ncbi:hypothetical protein HBP99_13785 [Listeria booriae]|uniref:hypothetical protein n=1 Tax=Listeria booriae TaxID=1552123 RepID=UPI001628AB2A|nr:hypothetical protein [Listeria booriae]MBC2369713.1 hypothetical protein [Listeria booriae]
MRLKKRKDGGTYVYTGDLRKEIIKCEKELKKIETDLPYLKFASEQAQKPYEQKKKRLADLKDFISLAKEKLNEEDANKS